MAKRQRAKVFGHFVAFLRKQDRLLTICGALIVFVTFVVKDAMRDDFKDQLQSIEEAHAYFTLAGDMRDVQNRLNNIQTVMDRDHAPNDGVIPRPFIARSEWNRALFFRLLAASDALGRCKRLLDHLPNAAEEERLAAHIKAELDKQLEEHRNSGALALLQDEPSPPELIEKFKDLERKLAGDWVSLSSLQFRLNFKSQQAVHQSKKSLETYTRLSYALFGVGWLLTLVGKLFSIKGLATGEA